MINGVIILTALFLILKLRINKGAEKFTNILFSLITLRFELAHLLHLNVSLKYVFSHHSWCHSSVSLDMTIFHPKFLKYDLTFIVAEYTQYIISLHPYYSQPRTFIHADLNESSASLWFTCCVINLGSLFYPTTIDLHFLSAHLLP
jgi:hypothetical protein